MSKNLHHGMIQVQKNKTWKYYDTIHL